MPLPWQPHRSGERAEFCQNYQNSAPVSRQHFDIWQFQTSDKTAGQQSSGTRVSGRSGGRHLRWRETATLELAWPLPCRCHGSRTVAASAQEMPANAAQTQRQPTG
jgi:hypothetical protein